MIDNPQIFIIYEPGMYGTFLANLFSLHKLMSDEYIFKNFSSDRCGYNAHRTGYRDRLEYFHGRESIENLLKKNESDLKLFFSPLNKHKLSIHRISSYFSIKINFEKFFSNYVRILLIPKKTRIKNYAERMFFTTQKTYETEYWRRNIKKQLNKLPKNFLEGMSIKEKEKYLTNHLDFIMQNYKPTKSNDIIFDPDDIPHQDSLNKVINDACRILNIEPIELPTDEIIKFINTNQQFFKNTFDKPSK